MNIGIMCTCFPSIRLLLEYYAHRFGLMTTTSDAATLNNVRSKSPDMSGSTALSCHSQHHTGHDTDLGEVDGHGDKLASS
jgi:hypothetical protein